MTFGREKTRSWQRFSNRAFSVAALATIAGLSLVACAAETAPPLSTETTEQTPESQAPPPLTAEELRHATAIAYVDSLSTRERVASVIMSNSPGIDPQSLIEFVDGNQLGGFLLMGSNIPGSPEGLTALTSQLSGGDASFPRLIAIDQEGGEVTRLPWDVSLGASQLRFLPAEDTHLAFADRATLLRSAGINVNFGIVADLGTDPHAFIYWRTFGDTPSDAAARVAAAVSGENSTVASTLKHFPGHGAVTGDSHFGIPQTMQEYASWQTHDAVPFAAGIDAGAELLMFGHLSYASIDPLPASLSAEWHRIAREDLGFSGVAISDDLGMLLNSGLPEYSDISVIASQAFAAGADLTIVMQGVDRATLPQIIDEIAASVDAGGPTNERLREAAVRVAELRLIIGERNLAVATP